MIHIVFNEDLLTQCVEPKFQGQHKDPASPLVIINEEEEYEVEEVQKHRTRGRGTQYLVHWKGYCNDLKLELRLHLGKDLRKYKG